MSSNSPVFSRRFLASVTSNEVSNDAHKLPCPPNAALPTDNELEAYAQSIGLTNEVIYDHLRSCRLGRMERNGGKKSETFRVQKTIKKTRVEVGYIRFVKMTKFLKSKADFTRERVASTFKVKDALLAEFATWMENELWIKHKFDDIGSSSSSLAIGLTNEALQDSTCDDEIARSGSGKQGKDLGPRASFMKACKERDYDAIAIGLGLHPLDLQGSSQGNAEVALQERFDIEIQRMCNVHSIATTEEFIPLLNLYLLWRHKEKPTLWDSGHDLLITPALTFNFIKAYVDGKMKLVDARTPTFACVVRDGVEYEFHDQTMENAIQSKTASRYVAALGSFQRIQGTLLGIKIDPVMQNDTMKSYLKNLQVDAPSTSYKLLLDRQRNVQYADFDVSKKEKESVVYLEKGSSCDIRDRAHMLATTYSVSRSGETRVWDLSDCFVFCYNQRLPGVTQQPIEVAYVLQHMSKTKSDDMLEDWNLVIRHRNFLECPLSGIALHLATRYLVDHELFPNLKGPKEGWYNVKLFQNQNAGTQELKSSGLYARKRKNMEQAGTMKRSILHDDRHHGALLAKLFGVPATDLNQLGTWEVSTKSRCYANVHQPLTVSRMSGFLENEEYFLSRNVLDPMTVADETIQSFVQKIFWQVEDHEWVDAINNKCKGGPRTSDYASRNVSSFFKLLRKILVQDLPLYYDRFPHLKIFKCKHFIDNWSGFQRWHRLQTDIIREVEKVRLQRPPELLSATSRRVGSVVSLSDEAPPGYIIVPIVGSEKLGYLRKEEDVSVDLPHAPNDMDFLHRIQSTDQSVKALWSLQEQNRTDLINLANDIRHEFKALHSAIERKGCEEHSIVDSIVVGQVEKEDAWTFPLEETSEPVDQPPNEFPLRKLPKLSGMSLHDVYSEWTEGILENGKRGLPLQEIERLRLQEHIHLRNPKDHGLKSCVQKRRCLVKYLEQEAAKESMEHHQDSIEKAVEKISFEMESLFGSCWTLNQMYNHISGYLSKSNKSELICLMNDNL